VFLNESEELAMALQPIYGDGGQIVDYYDDGLPEEQPPEQHEERLPVEETSPAAREGEPQNSWTVPDLLKGMNDLFIGITVHHDDGHPQGPLVSLFGRLVPDGEVHVRTFRAAELSQQTFLDNLQKGIAVTMQVHFLAWAEQQRKKLAEEEKRKARVSSSTTKTAAKAPPTPTKVATPVASTLTHASSASAQKTAKSQVTTEETEKKPKYATLSMFD
jgi:hypothetical protein